MLKKYALLAIALLCLGLGTRSSGVGETVPGYMTGSELSEAGEHKAVAFTGQLVDVAESRSGKPMWVLECEDGYQAKVLIADDVQLPSTVSRGDRYSVVAHVLAEGGLLSAQNRDAIHHVVTTRVVATDVADVHVVGQWAYQSTGTGTRRMPAEVGATRVVDLNGQLRFVK